MFTLKKSIKKTCFLKTTLYSIFLIGIFLISIPNSVYASSLNISPSFGNYNIGDSFSVSVYVESKDQPLNVVSGRLNYQDDKLSVISVSKKSSIINFWTIDPGEYASEPGIVRFEGIVLNPGYKGPQGAIFSVTFKVKAQGVSPINFLSASVLANDGQGTNILESVSDGSYVLGTEGLELTTKELGFGIPLAPHVVSSTHKNGFEWYPINRASFTWNLAPDTTSVTYTIDKKPTTNPGTITKGMISNFTTDLLEDGIWYLHVRTKNDKGWGSITHFKFQIDTTPPQKLVITEMGKSEKTSPQARFMFESEDLGSGIEEYKIELGTSEGTTWFGNSTNIYETPVLPPGEHTMTVTAKDRAGNGIKEKKTFSIIGLPTPKIIEYTDIVIEGQPIIIKGISFPGYEIMMSFATDGDMKLTEFFRRSKSKSGVIFETTTKTKEDGTFTIELSEKFGKGQYSVQLKAVNSQGATSNYSEPVMVTIKSKGFFDGIFGSIVGLILITITIFAFLLIFARYKMKLMKHKVSHELLVTENILAKSFDILSKDAEVLRGAGMRDSTDDGEKRLIFQHSKDIEEAERIIRSKIHSMKEGLESLNEK